MKLVAMVAMGCSILLAEESRPVETTNEENAILYKIDAEVRLLQEYQKEAAQQITEKQREWDEEQAAIFARTGKKAEEFRLQVDPKAKPRPRWALFPAPPKPAEPAKTTPPSPVPGPPLAQK